jgi:hypothetical protein
MTFPSFPGSGQINGLSRSRCPFEIALLVRGLSRRFPMGTASVGRRQKPGLDLVKNLRKKQRGRSKRRSQLLRHLELPQVNRQSHGPTHDAYLDLAQKQSLFTMTLGRH